jgi:DNA/RNA-binding protein KIN17
MGRAEIGSTKHLANKMKAKGLQRLRWYCQACERQMRDENGFKQHTMSESHIRNMQLIGEDPKKFIRQFSEEFKSDFVKLLRTAHGEKPVQLNRFYQEYIANKEHVHMNATQWSSLHEFAKYLGREGVCRVTEEEGKGVYIAWIDNSPEALRRQDAIRKKERQDRGDEEREKKAIEEQIERAHREAREAENAQDGSRALERKEGEKITLQFGAKPKPEEESISVKQDSTPVSEGQADGTLSTVLDVGTSSTPAVATPPAPVKISFGSTSSKPKNVFSAAKKNALAVKKPVIKEPAKKMSEAERIMREEMERKNGKRRGEEHSGGTKKMKINL